MAKQLKVEDNYVVHYDTTAGEYVESFAINHCVYRENENAFIILEQIDKEILTINKADVIAGAWIDGNSIAYTEDGIRTFLQQSTGFKTAEGSSSAIEGNGTANTFPIFTDVQEIGNSSLAEKLSQFLEWNKGSGSDGIVAGDVASHYMMMRDNADFDNGSIQFFNGTYSGDLNFNSAPLTASQFWNFPDKSGTIALTSDLPQTQYTEVDIATNPLPIGGLDLTTPFEVLPRPNLNEYYDIKNVILEWHYGGQTTAQNMNGIIIRIEPQNGDVFYNYRYYAGANHFLEREGGIVILEKSRFETTLDGVSRDYDLAEDTFTHQNGWDISMNNIINGIVGTLKVKIWYEVRTYGSEL